MYSENQTEPILIIIQQGLHNDVVTILRKGIATTENISFHNPLLGLGLPWFPMLISSPQRTVKWTDKDQVTHMEQWYHYLISLNGSKLGSSSVAGYSGTVFEPIDEFKGDIARISTLRPAMKPLFLVTHILCSTEQPIRYSQLPFLNML
jgi:hypothetical protein